MKEMLHMNVGVRPAREDDDAPLAQLDASAWPPELQVVPPRPAHEAFFGGGRLVEDVLVGTVRGDVAGYAHLVRHLPVAANSHVLHLNALVVDPANRGLGLGSALLTAAIVEAQRRGVRKLGLRVLSTNTTAHALYVHAALTERSSLGERRHDRRDHVPLVCANLDAQGVVDVLGRDDLQRSLGRHAGQAGRTRRPSQGNRGPADGGRGTVSAAGPR
jgi:GNAT superfamily N-acetyltransferase